MFNVVFLIFLALVQVGFGVEECSGSILFYNEDDYLLIDGAILY